MPASPDSDVDWSLPDDPVRWAVVHTRPRSEKKLARAARSAGLLVYLPVQACEHRYGNRRRMFTKPVFPGYVFFRGDPVQRQWLSRHQAAARLLEVEDQSTLLRQLRQLHLALESGLLVETMPFLEAGRPVRITAGPLRGAEGIVMRVQGRTRVLLNIDMIRQSAVVEVDSASLAPL